MSDHDEFIDIDAAIKALSAAMPTKNAQRRQAFEKLLPSIEGALARKVPQKQVIATLARSGLKLSVGTFKKLLQEVRTKSAKEGSAQ